MSKSKFEWLVFSVSIFVLIFVGSANSADIIYAPIMSWARDGSWYLTASVSLDDTPLSTPVANILGTDYALDYYDPFWDHWNNLNLGINPPSLINGTTVYFTVDGNTISGVVPSTIFEMPYSTYHGTIGGTFSNPIISWSNSFNSMFPGDLLDQYRIRVVEEGVDGLVFDYKKKTGLENEYQVFDFSTVSFEFDSKKKYQLRLEARTYEIFGDGLMGIYNVSVIFVDYVNHSPAPIPSIMLLLDSSN